MASSKHTGLVDYLQLADEALSAYRKAHPRVPQHTPTPDLRVKRDDEPKVVRLSEHQWLLRSRTWAQWKAEQLNRLFAEQGATGVLGNIKPNTIVHGEQPVPKSRN